MSKVCVAVGVIIQENECLISKRAALAHQGGLWEFPGGKREEGETTAQALSRELSEELGIELVKSAPLIVVVHDYGDKEVELDVLTVTDFNGEPYGREGQPLRWVPISELRKYSFPDGNIPILKCIEQCFRSY
ncbi:MAG: 8-oxo-dGTP diphosphatase MutT [Pseudomonadota bacterium]